MLLYERTIKELAPQNYLGAREIKSFDGTIANDNGMGGAYQVGRAKSGRWWVLPAVAFTGGLTAALIVTGLGDWLGLAG